MYHRDHNPPHIHVIYQGYEAMVAIEDARVLRGKLPPTVNSLSGDGLPCGVRPCSQIGLGRGVTNLWKGSRDLTTMMIKVRKVKALEGHRLTIEFSDDTVGERDFSFITEEAGPMLEPLKDVDYFRRVFVEDGVLTWPNGYDWDPIALHDEMKQAGELRPVGDAAE